jgi:hypothetical protein
LLNPAEQNDFPDPIWKPAVLIHAADALHSEFLGVDAEKLRDWSYIEYKLALDIEGKEVSFGTKDEEYNGRHSVRVAWIGRKSDPNLSRSAARYFGGAVDKPAYGGDIPF